MRIPKHWIHIIALSFVLVVAFQNCTGKQMSKAKKEVADVSIGHGVNLKF